MNTFTEFGLLPSLLKTLKTQKISTPTEIQKFTIPLIMSGQSVVGVSETGSGKTLAYALPLMHFLRDLEESGRPVTEPRSPRVIVMVPSRDLGEQVAKVFKVFTHDTRLRVRSALGGMALEQARRNVEGPFEILLATPGRLIQMLNKNLVDLSGVKILVFDEADQMLDQGFISDSNQIVEACSQEIRLALFSATVSKPVEELMNSLFAKAEIIRSSGAGKTVKTLKTVNETIIDGVRWPIFEKILKTKIDGGTIVFANTREQCDKIAKQMTDNGYPCLLYRGEMEKTERRANLKKFRSGEVPTLIATDLASRGLDVENVARVVNYHLPQEMENYIHRAGRTARAGRVGLVINLVTERDLKLIAKIEGKGKSPKELKERFLDRDGKRLHIAEELRKPNRKKAAPSEVKHGKPGPRPKFKPKPKPPGFEAWEAEQKKKAENIAAKKKALSKK